MRIREDSPVADQAAAGGEEAVRIDRRQSIAGRQGDNRIVVISRQRTQQHDQTVIRSAGKCRDGMLDLPGITGIEAGQWASLR